MGKGLGTNTVLVDPQRLPQKVLLSAVLMFVIQLPIRFAGDTARPEGSWETWHAGSLSTLPRGGGSKSQPIRLVPGF